jgi:pimeloyl-ACP methyl ester carboxylesterase
LRPRAFSARRVVAERKRRIGTPRLKGTEAVDARSVPDSGSGSPGTDTLTEIAMSQNSAQELGRGEMHSDAHSFPRERRAPGLLLQLLEVRAIGEHYAALAMRPIWGAAAKGDGHPVLVLPGLAAGDASTALLRRFLRSRGYSTAGWGRGLNLGLHDGVLERVHEKLRELWLEHGRAVSIVGWSLGGLYARELAKQSPHMVRLVITLGSPFAGHPRETNAWRLYELTSGHRVDSQDAVEPLRTPPPVPTTSIWSPTDGVVSWRCSVETRLELAENIVVESSHLGLGAHPATLFAVADRLAQPEGYWAPFHRRGWRRLVYGDPLKLHGTGQLHFTDNRVRPSPSLGQH